MKNILLFLSILCFYQIQSVVAGYVIFETRPFGTTSRVLDYQGNPASGAGYVSQIYAAEGLEALESELQPKGTKSPFRLNSLAGYPGQQESVQVTSAPTGPASVQIRAWSAPFESYEAAQAGGGYFGKSRILRIAVTGNPDAEPPTQPVPLQDASGPVNGFQLAAIFPSISVNDLTVAEGTNGTVQAVFQVTLSQSATNEVTVGFFTQDEGAFAGSDYTATNGVLVFASGITMQTVSITVTADGPVESDENFYLNLTNAVNGIILKSQGVATITEVQIQGLSIDTSITFNTIAGHTYIVEKNDDPGTGEWSAVTGAESVLGIGGPVTVSDRGTGCNGTRIYRARLLQ